MPGVVGALAEGDEAVVEEVGDGVEDHAGEGGDSVAREGVGPEVPEHCCKGGVGVERPDDEELQRVADAPADDEAGGLGGDFSVGMEDPCLVPDERVDDAGHVTEEVGEVGIYADYRFAEHYDDEGHEGVHDSYGEEAEKLI